MTQSRTGKLVSQCYLKLAQGCLLLSEREISLSQCLVLVHRAKPLNPIHNIVSQMLRLEHWYSWNDNEAASFYRYLASEVEAYFGVLPSRYASGLEDDLQTRFCLDVLRAYYHEEGLGTGER